MRWSDGEEERLDAEAQLKDVLSGAAWFGSWEADALALVVNGAEYWVNGGAKVQRYSPSQADIMRLRVCLLTSATG